MTLSREMSVARNRRVELAGAIASGKTTLARSTCRSMPGVAPVYEEFRSNPFWRAFYQDPKRYAFETEITFLLQHYHNVQRTARTSIVQIVDYSMYLDLAYARVGLDGSTLRVFEEVYGEVLTRGGVPSVVIHVSCGVSELLRRIAARGRIAERGIDAGFLTALDRQLGAELEHARRDGVVVVSLDSESADFRRGGRTEMWSSMVARAIEVARRQVCVPADDSVA